MAASPAARPGRCVLRDAWSPELMADRARPAINSVSRRRDDLADGDHIGTAGASIRTAGARAVAFVFNADPASAPVVGARQHGSCLLVSHFHHPSSFSGRPLGEGPIRSILSESTLLESPRSPGNPPEYIPLKGMLCLDSTEESGANESGDRRRGFLDLGFGLLAPIGDRTGYAVTEVFVEQV